MDSGNTVVRSKKIRIYPKPESIDLFKKYCGLSRYWYNQAVAYLKTEGTRAYLPEVRKIQNGEHAEWAFDCPQRIREHAMKDACDAVKNAKLKFFKSGNFQEVRFRSKKDPLQGFGFDKSSLKDFFVFGGKKSKAEFFAYEKISPSLEGTRIKCENGRWFVILPQNKPVKKPENQRFEQVSLDPGIRTFVSFFSPEFSGKIGEGDFCRIFRLCLQLDSLISKISQSKGKRKRRLKMASNRLRWKIKDLVDELHHKVAYFLVTTFDRVFIPTFETSQMVSKLRSKTARMMLTFAHYRFKDFLKAKAEEYSCEVVDVNEAYTSKTCSYCGQLHNIGSKNVLKCECGAVVDRDLNGGRGIFLRSLLASTSQN